MKKILTLLLALVCITPVFQIHVMAETRLRRTNDMGVQLTSEDEYYKFVAVPFEVDVIERASRYAVDVEKMLH